MGFGLKGVLEAWQPRHAQPSPYPYDWEDRVAGRMFPAPFSTLQQGATIRHTQEESTTPHWSRDCWLASVQTLQPKKPT